MASNAGFVPLATHANQANLSTPRLKLLHESLILRELDRQNALDTSTPVNTGSSTIKGFLDQLIKDHRNNGTTLLKRGRGRALLHADVSYMTKVYEALAKKNIDGRRGSQTRCLFNNGSRVVLDHNKLILDALNAPLLTAAVAAPIVQTTNIQQNSLNPTTAQGPITQPTSVNHQPNAASVNARTGVNLPIPSISSATKKQTLRLIPPTQLEAQQILVRSLVGSRFAAQPVTVKILKKRGHLAPSTIQTSVSMLRLLRVMAQIQPLNRWSALSKLGRRAVLQILDSAGLEAKGTMSITAVNAREKYALKKLLARCDQKQEFLRNGDGLLALIATMMDELVFRKELGVGARGKAHLRSREWLHIKSRQIALQLSHDIFGSLSNWLDAMFRGDQKLINILEEALYPFFRRAVNLKAHLEVQSKQGPYTTSWPPYHMKASWGEHEEYDFFEQWSDVDCLVIDLPAFTELASHEVVGNPVLSARNVDEEGDEVLQEQVYMALCGPPDQRQQDDEARTQESQTEVHGHRNALVASPSPARSPNGANQSRKHGLEGQEQAGPHVPYKKMKFASAVPPGFFSSDSQRTDHGSPEAMGSDQILKWSSDSAGDDHDDSWLDPNAGEIDPEDASNGSREEADPQDDASDRASDGVSRDPRHILGVKPTANFQPSVEASARVSRRRTLLADDDDAASDASGATNTGRSTVNAFSASGRALRAQQKTLPSQSKKRKGSFVDDVDFETDLKRPRTRSAVDVSTARSVKVKKEDEDERGPLQADPSKRGMSAANARDLPPSLAARSPVINPSTVAPQSVAASATLPNPSFGFSFRSATSPTALSPTQEHGRQQLANERARRAQKDFDADDEDEDDDDHEDGLPDDDAGAPWRSR